MSDPRTEHLEKLNRRNQKLLDAIKEHLPQLEQLLRVIESDYEDRIYRFYYESSKIYSLQGTTLKAVEIFKNIGQQADARLCDCFEEIILDGTGKNWKMADPNWRRYQRSIVEAFLHTKYFVEMMVKYGRELETLPKILPSGWAAILMLYGQR